MKQLDKINNINDIKGLNISEKKELANEIREFLIEKVSKNGGHLASNLGIVELTISLCSVFNFEYDKIVFDVGHQSYVYKILTGRKDRFDTLRKYKGLRGFPYKKESPYDYFETGHSSTAISASVGMARARDINKEEYNIVSVVGDGAISSGMSLEAINDVGFNKTKMIIILNDNGMSISSNVGGISSYLSKLSLNEKYIKIKNALKYSLDDTPFGDFSFKMLSRMKDGIRKTLVPSKYFEDMGLTYIGPIDGHNINEIEKVLRRAKKINEPVIIHVVTKKGKGYKLAENTPEKYHGVSPFDIEEGVKSSGKESYSSAFGKAITKLASKDKSIVAITAAMQDGVGLQEFAKKYPDRYFDVGISEEHAVTLAAGMSVSNVKPIFAVYSTFLQRGFDQIVHDVCMQNSPMIFAIDRAGLVGSDGETHQGILDLSYLSIIPNMTIISPKCISELETLLEWSTKQTFPIAIRYPRGGDYISMKPLKKIELGKWEYITKGKNLTIIATGKMVQKAYQIINDNNLDITLINATFIKPLDKEVLRKIIKNKDNVLTLEDNLINGGLGHNILLTLNELNFNKKIKILGFNNKFVEQGSIEELYTQEHLDNESILKEINKLLK